MYIKCSSGIYGNRVDYFYAFGMEKQWVLDGVKGKSDIVSGLLGIKWKAH